MSFPITHVSESDFPRLLREIPQPPATLNYRGKLPPSDMKLLAVVGSRKYTTYGLQAVQHILGGLRGYNIGIVSGLALGIDSLAHQAALDAGLYTLAIPGGGLDDSVIYPASHKPLARKILESGGGLLSEYESTFKATTWSFPQRNRLVCGISHATLLIEAQEKSGTLITARMAVDYNRDLLAVPGSIFSDNSKGTHQFLKLGATPATSADDILAILDINPEIALASSTDTQTILSPLEKKVLELLHEPIERDALIRQLAIATSEASILLMQMEMQNLIAETNGTYRKT